jgi:hypothetical protein
VTWWLRAAEELRTLRRLGIGSPASVISGFPLETPTATIEGTAREVRRGPGGDGAVADPPAAPALPAQPEPAASAPPVAQQLATAKLPQSSFLRGGDRYKLRWEIRPQAGKTASK